MVKGKTCCVTYLLSLIPLLGGAQVLPHYTVQGNLDQQGMNVQLVYNPQNQLIHTPQSQYAYFANGLLASETADRHALYYYPDRSGERRNASDGTHFASYLLGYRALMRSMSGQPQSLYLANMHLSIIGTIAAHHVQMQQYGLYGQSLITPQSTAFALRTNPLNYASYPVDPVTHWYDLQARFYVPALGQFASRDTFNLTNRYFYANNNPAMMIDPKGHAAQSAQPWPWQFYPIVGGGIFLGALSAAGIVGVKHVMQHFSRVAPDIPVSPDFSDTASDSGSISSEYESRDTSPISDRPNQESMDAFFENLPMQVFESEQNAKLRKWMDSANELWDQTISQKVSLYFERMQYREIYARHYHVEREELAARNRIDQAFMEPIPQNFFGETVLVRVNGYGAEQKLYGDFGEKDGMRIHYITNSQKNDKAFADMKKVVLKPNEPIQPNQEDTAWFFSQEELDNAVSFLR